MFFLLFLLSAYQGANVTPPCQARLEMKQQDGMLTIVGHCRNLMPAAGRYRYELSMLREGAGGRSQNTQRGEFEVAAQQEVSLSHSSVNVSAQDSYRIYLRVLDVTGNIVAQDSASQVAAR